MSGRTPTFASLHGMVAAAQPLAAQAGARLLAAGGNAFDAAAAAAAALGVVEPFYSGLAGMGAATCFVAAEARVRTLDFISRVPLGFPEGRFHARAELARGPMACGAPAALAGWCELVTRHGRKRLPEVLAPAIALAREGVPMAPLGAATLASATEALSALPFFADWRQTYHGHLSGAPGVGQVQRQPDLARTLELIAAEGPGHLYGGPLGRALVEHVQAMGGCLALQDLAAVQPAWLDPATAPYRDLILHTPPPPCEGFQFLLTMRILAGFDLAAMARDGAEHLDHVWRAIRLAAGRRIAHNKPGPEELAELLGDASVEKLRELVRAPEPVTGPTEQWQPAAVEAAREHTTSFVAADREGNVVAITQSLGSAFGCGVVVPGTGVCLNNLLAWGDADPRGGNPLHPGSDLALPIAPALATREGKPALALATPGSYGISQTQAQALVQHVDFRLAVADAIAAPRARLFDGAHVLAEDRFGAETLAALAERGHKVETTAAWSVKAGGMQGIALDPASGALFGTADPRRDGAVAIP